MQLGTPTTNESRKNNQACDVWHDAFGDFVRSHRWYLNTPVSHSDLTLT